MADTAVSPSSASLRLTSVAPDHVVTGHTDATSGVARSGCARSGLTGTAISWFEDWTEIRVGGVDVTNAVDWDEFEISEGLSSDPSSCVCQFMGRPGIDPAVVPEWGETLTVWLGGTDRGVPLFGGTIVSTSTSIRKASDETERLVTTVMAQDWRWMLNRTSLVSGTFYSGGVNSIVRAIVGQFTDSASGFTVGYIPSALGSLDSITFDGTLVSEALTEIATAAGAVWVIEPTKRITMFSPTASTGIWTDRIGDGAGLVSLGLANQPRMISDITLERDVSEYANEVRASGAATKVRSAASAGDTEVEVENLAPFNNFGAVGQEYVLISGDELQVTFAATRASGPGTLQLTDPLLHNAEVGDSVVPIAYSRDTDGQSELASHFGDGQSGVVTSLSVSEDLGGNDLLLFSFSQLNALKFVRETISCRVFENSKFSYQTFSANIDKIVPGRMMFINRDEWLGQTSSDVTPTGPLTIRTNLAIRRVTTRFRGRRPENGVPTYERRIEAARIVQPLSAILIRALDHERSAI